MELLRVMVIQILQQLHFFMELEKTCSCYIPSTTILLSVTDVRGVGANPCSWTWGWVCNDKAATLTNARLSSTSDIFNLLLSCTCFWRKPSAT